MIFHYYNLNHKIVIKTDVSNYIFESILFQYSENEVFYLIVYFLKKHNSARYNYKIYKKKFIKVSLF